MHEKGSVREHMWCVCVCLCMDTCVSQLMCTEGQSAFLPPPYGFWSLDSRLSDLQQAPLSTEPSLKLLLPIAIATGAATNPETCRLDPGYKEKRSM